jgi:hypothetical protein
MFSGKFLFLLGFSLVLFDLVDGVGGAFLVGLLNFVIKDNWFVGWEILT